MATRLTLLLLSLLTLAACDPVVQVEATVHVSDEIAEQQTVDQAQAVVVLDDANGQERVVGVVCGPTGDEQVFTYLESHIGCASEADVSAVLVPVGGYRECGGAYDAWEGPIPTSSPTAKVTVFAGQEGNCAGGIASIELRLE